MLGDWVNVFHLPPHEFWKATPHEFMAASESNQRQAQPRKQDKRSSLKPDDVTRLKNRLADAKEAEARHRAAQNGAHTG